MAPDDNSYIALVKLEGRVARSCQQLFGRGANMSKTVNHIPSTHQWLELGFTNLHEIDEGRQSRAFSAQRGLSRVVIKLTDAHIADFANTWLRMTLMSDLANAGHPVALPVPIAGSLVHRWGRWLMSATEFIDGVAPDITRPEQSKTMGQELASLHQVLRDAPQIDLPAVAALGIGSENMLDPSWQLLHGDFNATNMRLVAGKLFVFDFDECGYGPVEYDVANCLYMVLFDSIVNPKADVDYESFRDQLLEGYSEIVGRPIPLKTVETFIKKRVDALGYWLDNLTEAPIGIQTSGPEWLATLRRFVDGWPLV